MKDKSEKDWIRCIHRVVNNTVYEGFRGYLLIIPKLPLGIRKDLLKVSRCQCSVNGNPFLKLQLAATSKPEYTSIARGYVVDGNNVSIKGIVTRLSEGCHLDAAFSALLSVLTRSAPIFLLSEEHVEENRIASWNKEIEASVGPDRPNQLDYSLWFAEEDATLRKGLSGFLGPNPLNRSIRKAFHEWRDSFQGKLLLPQLSSFRNISRKTAYNYACHKAGRHVDDYEIDVNTRVLERYYMLTGHMVGGPTELRQAWKYNEITPRTYFALGGTTFHGSKYIRQVANSLCNLFPMTNFRTRFSTNVVVPSSSDVVFTYDYSSFTSNFTELKYFLRALSDFCAETKILLHDSHLGIIHSTLGDVIADYLDETSTHPCFTIQRYLNHVLEPLIHNRAGMLGVFGNITFCTTLHGLHACQLCGSMDCCCVGDDAFGSAQIDYMEDFVDQIRTLGEINPDKVKFWYGGDASDPNITDPSSQRWPFIKRPMERYGNRMIHEFAILLPIFGEVVPIIDPFRDRRDVHPKRLLSLLASQSRTLVRQISLFVLSDDQKTLIRNYMRMIYSFHNLPYDGVPSFSTFYHPDMKVTMSNWLLPSIDAYLTGRENEGFEMAFEPGGYRVPKVVDEDFTTNYLQLDFADLEAPADPFLQYLTHLEVVDADPVFEIRYFGTMLAYDAYQEAIFNRQKKVVYVYTKRYDPPWWFSEMCLWMTSAC